MSSPTQSKGPLTDKVSVVDGTPVDPHPHIPDCTFSTEFWHTDGDILIRVQTTWYLLHRGLLAAHSKLFRPENIHRMATGQDLIGRQLFVPPCDDQWDWERMLTSVYNPAKLNLWSKSLSGDNLLSLIRVAKTLKFRKLVTLGLERLDTELPMSLDAFDAAYAVPKIGSVLKPTACISDKEELFETINLALELDHTRVLPCAYLLALMEASIEEITDGIASFDGPPILLHPKARQTLLIAHARIYPILLHRFSETLSCLTARLRHCISHPLSIACLGAANASEARLRAHIASPKVDADITKRRLVIASHREGEWFEEAFNGRCAVCREVAKTQMYEQRKKFWEQVPELFGLGSWNDICGL